MKLIPNKKYNLKYTGEFCNIVSVRDSSIKSGYDHISKFNPYTFVGTIQASSGFRNIFISLYNSDITYAMYSCGEVEKYATPVKTKIKLSDIAKKFGIDINEIEIDND